MSGGPSLRELVGWDRRHLWHPFTQMREWFAEEPLFIERGEGNYLIDTEGRRYLDGVSSLWCNVHGHRKPELDAALREQVERIAHTTMLGLGNIPATVLAKRLVEITPPNLTRVFYSDAGATATEIAFKMALQYWHLRGETKRTRFVALTEGYHGDTLGAVSVGWSETFHRFFRPVVSRPLQIDPPHVFRWQRGQTEERALESALTAAERVFARHGEEIAALVIEPLMQGAAGMWTQPTGYIRALRELTRRHGSLLVCDEVATGFGRTGRMFAVDHESIEPDLLCLGKGITGGYMPLAATLATEEIFSAFLAPYESFHAFFHGHTYTGNPLACAVALANLDVFEREAVVERVRRRATRLTEQLRRRCAGLRHVGDVRQSGLMAGIELIEDRDSRRPYPPGARIAHKTILAARRHGVILRPLGNVIILMPPLSITEDEVDRLAEVAAACIEEATAVSPGSS
jgi:adenosylmethionine-8-amino-7-oxononanoate aminotransferase